MHILELPLEPLRTFGVLQALVRHPQLDLIPPRHEIRPNLNRSSILQVAIRFDARQEWRPLFLIDLLFDLLSDPHLLLDELSLFHIVPLKLPVLLLLAFQVVYRLIKLLSSLYHLLPGFLVLPVRHPRYLVEHF